MSSVQKSLLFISVTLHFGDSAKQQRFGAISISSLFERVFLSVMLNKIFVTSRRYEHSFHKSISKQLVLQPG